MGPWLEWRSLGKEHRLGKEYSVGDQVVFRMQKRSLAPGPRAKNVQPAPHGDEYGYNVEKYWRVAAKLPDGRLEVITRRGKRHEVRADDPRLRSAFWWERWLLRDRFPPEDLLQPPGGGPHDRRD